MSRGKYLNLKEARKAKRLNRFAKEHPIEDVHPRARSRFKAVLNAMVTGLLEGGQTSRQGSKFIIASIFWDSGNWSDAIQDAGWGLEAAMYAETIFTGFA